jgi:hypothetical protein
MSELEKKADPDGTTVVMTTAELERRLGMPAGALEGKLELRPAGKLSRIAGAVRAGLGRDGGDTDKGVAILEFLGRLLDGHDLGGIADLLVHAGRSSVVAAEQGEFETAARVFRTLAEVVKD